MSTIVPCRRRRMGLTPTPIRLTPEQAERADSASDLIGQIAGYYGRMWPSIGEAEFRSAAGWDLCLAARRWREGRQPWRSYARFAVRHACLNVIVKARRRPASEPIDPNLASDGARRVWC